MNTSGNLPFIDWGLIDYQQALQQQLELVEKVAEEKSPGYLIFCTHPPVVTLGRGTRDGDVFSWQGPIQEISRGGRATYHGPNQVVVYPILNLNFKRQQRPAKDLGGYLQALEQAIVRSLKKYGIESLGKSLQKNLNSGTETSETGVWVGPKKVASLGLAVRKWVSFHGAAINVHEDVNAFQGLKPCGFSSDTMISVESLVGRPVDESEFKSILKTELEASL
jgi:lipoate-protein ligase B